MLRLAFAGPDAPRKPLRGQDSGLQDTYVNKLKKQISIRIDNDTIEYFKSLAAQTAIPYQSLINLFLAECASKELKPSVLWQNDARSGRASTGRRPERTPGRTRSAPDSGSR